MAATMKNVNSTISITGLARREAGLSLTTESSSVLPVRRDGRLGSLTFPRTRPRASAGLAKEVHHALEEGKQRPEHQKREESEDDQEEDAPYEHK